MALQPQRVPLGKTDDGRPVYITVEWLKVLQALDGSVIDGSGSSAAGAGTGAASPDAIDLPYDDAAGLKVLAIGLQRALQALEAETALSALRAELATLKARVEGLEQTL